VSAPAPHELRTDRLLLRRPYADDAEAIFERFAGDPVATRYMGWPRHQTIDETVSYLGHSAQEWNVEGVGAYVILDPPTGRLLGSTGIHMVTGYRAITGYILARDAWGRGIATEACAAMVSLARRLGIARIEADCHPDNRASSRVLEKSGLLFEGILRAYLVFPNLGIDQPEDVLMYGLALQR
jgi:ribosomal-protein-alanine N-acetyltransferase